MEAPQAATAALQSDAAKLEHDTGTSLREIKLTGAFVSLEQRCFLLDLCG
jgi:hypothetical protein